MRYGNYQLKPMKYSTFFTITLLGGGPVWLFIHYRLWDWAAAYFISTLIIELRNLNQEKEP